MNSERQNLYLLDGHKPNSNDLELLMSNSAFLWGMSVFTTGLISNGEIPFYDAHSKRLVDSAEWLWPGEFTSLIGQRWKEGFVSLDREIICEGQWRFRFTLFRDADKELHSLLSISPFQLEESKVHRLALALNPHGHQDRKSNVKLGNYLDTFRAQELKDETLLFYNHRDLILETAVANIIFYDERDDSFIAPYVSGEMLLGIGVEEGLKGLNSKMERVERKALDRFDSAFIINSLRGPQPVVSLDGQSLKVTDELCSRVREQFERNKIKSQRNIWAKENI